MAVNMAVIIFSRSLVMRLIGAASAIFLVVAGLFALVIGTTHKIPYADKMGLMGEMDLLNTARADTPVSSCGSCSSCDVGSCEVGSCDVGSCSIGRGDGDGSSCDGDPDGPGDPPGCDGWW